MTLSDFAQQVLHMRLKQQEYFRLAAQVKKDPSLHGKRKEVLAQSVQLEEQVDNQILQIIQASKEAANG